MIERVYKKAIRAALLDRIIIATDDERIFQAAQSFGAEVWMTSPRHKSGTDRAAEVASKLRSPIILNIQGDEPLLRGEQIDSLVEALQDESIPMATLAFEERNPEAFSDPNTVKVVFDPHGSALYFSRSPIPYQSSSSFWRHIGIYGFQRKFLLDFCRLPASPLEKSEKLEQLRALENGFKIKVVKTDFSTLSIDTPKDIITVENLLKRHGEKD